ncbi:hypothetical protein GCM10009828_052790 [Actinoplanes couchii]|uniref:Uncharacterized protein n=1 Tax=Actinoplanes couchii TaxID=403638 RepID=A0ABQ3XR14_9ACTN|nr:hypothetical protein Aco03nite_093620 [Actinoplanes couchii]
MFVHGKGFSFVMTVAMGAGKEMIVPIEGSQRIPNDRLMVVDVGTEAVPAVHATFDVRRHPLQDYS